MLAWSPSSDNVGVVEYGLYASGLRVATSSDANATLTSLECGTSYLVAIDAADAAGNRSAQASSYLRTSACPSSNQAPSTPTLVKVTAASQTSVSLVVDCLHRRRRGDAATGSISPASAPPRRPRPAPTSRASVRHELRARRRRVRRRRPALHRHGAVHRNLPLPSTPPPPPPTTTGTVTQTIANGATLSGRGQLARRLRQQRRHGRGRPRLDRVPRRRHPGAVRDQPALRRHRRLLGLHHRQRRPTHLPGARPQRRRHPPRHQHHHRHRRQQDTTAAADLRPAP